MVGILKKIALLIMVTVVSGCTTLYNPATGRNELILINSQTETAIGRSTASELNRKQRILTGSRIANKLGIIGARIAAFSDRKDIEYSFWLVDDKEPNAFTLPGGFVYMNSGLAVILDDDELAYVLGHEVGHAAARHIVKKMQSNMAYQLLLSLAFSGLQSGVGEPAVDIARGADAVYGLVGLGYSRKDELEADRIGVKYAFKAGFNPYAAFTALEKLKKTEGEGLRMPALLRTHPYADERISRLKEFIPGLINEGKDKAVP